MTAAAPSGSRPVEGFPRDRFLELLRQARSILSGADQQQALLEDLRIPPRAVLGRSTVAPPAPDLGSNRTAREVITAPGLQDTASDRPAEPGAPPDLTAGGDYLLNQVPAPSSGRWPVSSTTGGQIGEPEQPAGRAVAVRRFAEAILDAVATADHIDASVVLARRARDELAPTQQPDWTGLISELEDLQLESRRRLLAQGGFPDLESLKDWAGFECLHHYSLTDRFVGRREPLAQLDSWVGDADGVSVICLTALGGAGKSALAWRWVNAALTRLRQEGFRGALWCSFYEGTFKFEDFLRRALSFCGRLSPEGVAALTRAQVEEQLLEALTRDRWVVVIDGLERLMAGYAQAAERAIDNEGTRAAPDRDGDTRADRRMSEQRDGRFLARLSAPLASRLLITTRLAPAELEDAHDGRTRPHVRRIDLPGLGLPDAIALWNSFLPDAPVDDEIADVLKACGYHPLALSILARSVQAADGWDEWCMLHRTFAPSGSIAKVRAHVIDTCLRDLRPEAEDVLNQLAVSGKPMRIDEIEQAMREQSIANGEERWTRDGRVAEELRELIELGFVGAAVVDDTSEYDLHPVVRGLMWTRMIDPRRAPHQPRFLDHAMSELTAIPDPHLAVGPVQIQKAASIFRVLVSTGQVDRAWEMFRYKLIGPLFANGAHREMLDLFEQLLPQGDPLALLPLRSRREQADAADILGNLMMFSGDPDVADHLMTWCGILRLRINDLVGFLEVRRAQTWQSLYQGRLFDTELVLRQVKVEALARGDPSAVRDDRSLDRTRPRLARAGRGSRTLSCRGRQGRDQPPLVVAGGGRRTPVPR